MATSPATLPGFEVVHGTDPGDTLLAGFSAFGLAGLTAVGYPADTWHSRRPDPSPWTAFPP